MEKALSALRLWTPYAVLAIVTVYVIGHPDWVGACVYGLGLGTWVLSGWLDVQALRTENEGLAAAAATLRSELQKYRSRDVNR